MRFRLTLVLCCAAVLAAAPAAWARSAQTLLPGQKIFGELNANDRVTVLVDAVAGTKLSAKCAAYKGTTPRLDVALSDPDGAPIVLGKLKKTNAAATLVSFTGYVATRTGAYRLTVSSGPGAPGGFDLTVGGVAPATIAGTGTVDAAGDAAQVAFEALPGDSVVCTVKPAKRSTLKPILHQFVDAGGAALAIDAAKQSKPALVATLGTSRFDVVGAAGTSGAFTWKLKFVRAKAGKTALDAAGLNAAGTVSGTIVVDGQSTRSASAGGEKRRRRAAAPDVRGGEIVVSAPQARTRAEVEAAAAAAMPGARFSVLASLTDAGPYLLRVEHLARRVHDARAKSATRALAKTATVSGSFRWAEPNVVVTAYDDPNDPLYSQQFNLRYLGLPQAWQLTTGDASIPIAVVDTGSLPHPELITQYGPGYDFVTDPDEAQDGDGWDANPFDSSYILHGTHVAGIIGAKTNNRIGIAGVVGFTRLLPVRVLGKDGGTFFDVAAGLRWAVGLPVSGAPANPTPARVVNMSLGAHYDAQVLSEAVADVVANTNAVLVAAAGNEGTNDPSYPAAYPGVIAVYALDQNLVWASYSNYGPWISVGAPGGDPYRDQPGILSTYWDMSTNTPDYEELSGTSMASPQVAGIAALLIALKPTITRAEVQDALQKTAVDLGNPGFDTDYGWGMVNAQAAAQYVLTPFAPPNAVDVAPPSLSFDGVAVEAQVFVRTKSATPVTISQIDATTDQLSGWLTATADHMVTPATITVNIDPSLVPGNYSGKIRLTTSVGVVDVPVRAVVVPHASLNLVLVSVMDESGNVVARTTTSAAKKWAYSIPDVPLGRYHVVALADQNADLVLDRVDEWEGEWPISAQPEFVDVTTDSLDAADLNVPLTRYDARFAYDGVGSGHVAGAAAVRVTDAATGRVVAGADVFVGGGAPLTVSDARGRAVVVGAIAGGQTVTIAADGYCPLTRAGADAQFQSFELAAPATPTTTAVVATVRGLAASDHDVYVQVGDATGHAVYAGGADPQLALNPTTTADPVPVSATVFDSTGAPTRHAVFQLDALAPTIDVQTTALAVGGAQARFVQASAPTSSFTASGAKLASTTYLRWNNSTWLDVGDSPLAFGQNVQGWWADPGPFDPALAMKIEVVGTDPSGRTSTRIFYGDTTNLQTTSAAFTLYPPTALTSPANGSTGVSTSPTLTWDGGTGAQLHVIVVEQTGTPWRWTLRVAGGLNSLQIPPISSGGLASATNYRWSVTTYRFAGGFDSSNYRDAVLDTTPTSRTFSGWAAFTTQ